MTVEEVDLGYFGNIWVKQHRASAEGLERHGHTHKFDHVTLLAQGSVEVSVKGFSPKVFHAPTFIVIRKNYEHNFKALTDNALWYCVFAIAGQEYELGDLFGEKNDPVGSGSEGYAEVAPKIEALTKESDAHV
jgi:hypothetical protein